MTIPQKPSDYLIWLDLEMTGLDVEHNRIIEIATLITNNQLDILSEGPVFAIAQPESLLAGMDAWNTEHHTASGLVQRVRDSRTTVLDAEQATLDFLARFLAAGESPLCGNSIYQDRLFLARYMPRLEKFCHYRHIDVSTVKELARRWRPELVFQKQSAHRALDDIKESIAELKYYYDTFFVPYSPG
ncbi:MAG: oligoribonuclease [Gammaproteobacteria bacterium]|nr:oligoribonuclease [Gammaproteobacteria bacterium]